MYTLDANKKKVRNAINKHIANMKKYKINYGILRKRCANLEQRDEVKITK